MEITAFNLTTWNLRFKVSLNLCSEPMVRIIPACIDVVVEPLIRPQTGFAESERVVCGRFKILKNRSG